VFSNDFYGRSKWRMTIRAAHTHVTRALIPSGISLPKPTRTTA
jgi:hypothetical protein